MFLVLIQEMLKICIYMFGGSSFVSSLDLSHFNSSKVIDMAYMFYNLQRLTSLDFTKFDTSKVTDII